MCARVGGDEVLESGQRSRGTLEKAACFLKFRGGRRVSWGGSIRSPIFFDHAESLDCGLTRLSKPMRRGCWGLWRSFV